MSDSNQLNESRYFDALKNEKDQRISELNAYNQRLDRTILLYISAAYATIGLNAADKISVANLMGDSHYVLLSFLFIFLNACIILHGVSQSCWSMSLAKFIHVKLNNEMLMKFGSYARTDYENHYKNLYDINVLGWDDWREDIKGLANDTRGIVMILWIILVFGSSVYSLFLVNLKFFAGDYPVITSFMEFGLIGLYIYAFYAFAFQGKYIEHWHDISFDLKSDIGRKILLICTTGALLSVIVLIKYLM